MVNSNNLIFEYLMDIYANKAIETDKNELRLV